MIFIRSTLVACAALAAALVTTPALATTCKNGGVWPKCTPPSSSGGSQSRSDSASSAQAGSQAGAVGKGYGGNASGGAGGSGGSVGPISAAGGSSGPSTASSTAAGGSSGSSLTDSSVYDSNARSWSLFVPPPVFTPPMPKPEVPLGCPAPTESQNARSAVGGMLFSTADSLRDNDPCTAIVFSQLLWERCQYRQADRILKVGMKAFASRHKVEWPTDEDTRLTDYAPKECEVLRNPPPPAPPQAVLYIDPKPAQSAVPAPTIEKVVDGQKPCAAGQKRNSKGVCYKPTPACGTGAKLACVRPTT